jgi:hypothetical protein
MSDDVKVTSETIYTFSLRALERTLTEAMGFRNPDEYEVKAEAVYRYESDNDPRMPTTSKIFDGLKLIVKSKK